MYRCAWPGGCAEVWYDMVTFLDEEGPGRCDVPLCQHHYDLMVTTIIQLRTQGVTEVSD